MRQDVETELRFRIAFEKIITELSTEFISLDSEEIDEGIERALQRIAGLTGDDRSWMFLYAGDRMENIHEWCAEGIPSMMGLFDPPMISVMPEANEQIMRGEVVHVPRLRDHHDVSTALALSAGNQSNILVPMFSRGRVIGCLGFDSVRRERSWSDEIIVLLRAVGEMFVNALERKRVEESLQASQQAMSTLIGNLPGMAYRARADRNGTFEFVSDGSLELTGYRNLDLVESPRLTHLAMIAPQDRSAVRRAVRRALAECSPYESTHRILTSTGELKWVTEHARGVHYAGRGAVVLDGLMTDATDRIGAVAELEKRVVVRTRELARRRAAAEGLGDILEALNQGQPLPQVLDHIVGQAAQLMAASSAAIYRFRLGAGSSLTIVAATGLRARSALHRWVPVAPGLADALEVQRTPVVLGGESRSRPESPLMTELAAFHRRTLRGASGACVYVPMTISDALYGALAILIPADRDLASEDMELAKTLGRQASLAVTNDWLRTQAGERGAATERTRIASDLHDSVTQTLFSASMTAQALPAVFADDIDEGMVGLEQLHQLTQQANADMRALLIELRPAAIHETGLARALSALVAAIGSRGRLPIQLRIQGDLELPDDVEMGLYRIVQESLNNVVRHAEASSAEVVIRSGAAAVRMRITDDGRGFDPGAAESEHYGLAIMRERAAAIGARLRIEPAPKGGTRVSVYWPQSKGQRDRG